MVGKEPYAHLHSAPLHPRGCGIGWWWFKGVGGVVWKITRTKKKKMNCRLRLIAGVGQVREMRGGREDERRQTILDERERADCSWGSVASSSARGRGGRAGAAPLLRRCQRRPGKTKSAVDGEEVEAEARGRRRQTANVG